MMEISSFETTAFSRRKMEKIDSESRSPIKYLRILVSPGFFLLGLVVVGLFVTINANTHISTGHILTPGRFLVFMTITLILLTPSIRSRSKDSASVSLSTPSGSKPATAGFSDSRVSVEPSVSPAGPGMVRRYTSEFVAGLSSVPTRYDQERRQSSSVPRRPSGMHAPAPFLDDVHSGQKHEYTVQLAQWARQLEDSLIMPLIVKPLVEELEQSDALLSQIFQHYGAKLTRGEPSNKLDSSQVSLSDRYLPAPMSGDPQVVNVWQRRQLLEAMLTVQNFPRRYRDYIFTRLSTWAHRGGIRFAYRHDMRPDEEGPTDSHILAHVIFSSLDAMIGQHDPGFRARFVTTSASGSMAVSSLDEFQTLFSSFGSSSKLHGAHSHSKVVWLEELVSASGANRRGQPLHFNVATNQRVFGIQAGGGNLIEALCLFFHLLKQLSPCANWVQLLPHNLRIVIEAAVGTGSSPDQTSSSLTGSFFNSLSNPALPFRGL